MKDIKIGRLTLAFTFIALGLIIFLEKFTYFKLMDLLFILWPMIIIALGFEIIVSSFSKGEDYKRKNNLDILSISVIIILVTILGFLNFSLKLGDMNLFSKFINIKDEYNGVILEEITIDESKKLIIDESDIDIEVIKSESSKVKVRLEGEDQKNQDIKNDDKNLLEVTQVEGATRLTRKVKANTVYFMKINKSSMKYIVELPNDIDLEIISRNGDIKINDIESNVTIKSKDSDIGFENIKGDMSILNSSGDIDGKKLTGDIDVISSSGDVTLDSRFIKNIDVETQNGDVTLKLPEDQTGKFNIVSAYGNIDDELGFSIIESASTNSITEVRKIGNPVFNIRTHNGDITIETD